MLARDALEKAGEKLTVHENGVNQSTVLIEFSTFDEAINAYHSGVYQEALLALDNGADRDIRIFEGI